jgi:serine-type D-Ala-D-Ala carboxypeptidase/endopeptidase (penicillin-binding protein 4)
VIKQKRERALGVAGFRLGAFFGVELSSFESVRCVASRVRQFSLVILAFSATTAVAMDPRSEAQLKDLLGGNPGVGFSAVDVSNGKVLIESRADTPLKPASTLKLITSAAALSSLGADFQFQTSVFADAPLNSSGSRKVWLKGGGDPSLTTESLWLIARGLKRNGLRSVSELMVDDSFFIASRHRSGQRAYESGTSALAFNYNSLAFSVCPSSGGGVGIVSVEPLEPQIKLVGTVATVGGSGANVSVVDASGSEGIPAYRVSGEIGRAHGCSEIYRSVGDPANVAGATLAGYLEYLGIEVKKLGNSSVAGGAVQVYKHNSKSLSQILEDLNHFSTNMIAEQVITRLGQSSDRCSHQQGLRVVRSFLSKTIPNSTSGVVIVDGSGLSHDNRVSATAFTALLTQMHRNPTLGIEYSKSLSVSGRSGTLKRRDFGAGFVRGKTGTIHGVNALAGYLTTKNGKTVAFALLQNRGASQADAWDLERRVLGAIAANY